MHPLNDRAWQSDTRGFFFLLMDSQGAVNGTLHDGQVFFWAKLQLVADPLTLCTFFSHEFRVEVLFHRQTHIRVCEAMKAPVGLLSDQAVCGSRWRGLAPTSANQLNHHRQAGQRAFVFDVRKIPAVTMYHVSQRTAGKLFCLSCCLDIRSERFKAGTVLNFRHSASPIYIL